MMLSFLSAILFILDANRHFATQVNLKVWGYDNPHFWTQTGDWLWFILSGTAVAQALYLIARLRGEVRYYLSLPKSVDVSKPL